MKKEYCCHSIFLLLCPFYGVRAQERPFFDLSGKGWHLWQDKNAAWQTEDIYLTLEEAQKSPVIVPTAGWDILTSAQTLPVQVPGTAEEYLQNSVRTRRRYYRSYMVESYNGYSGVEERTKSLFEILALYVHGRRFFINQRLVDYQIVDNVSFETDITPYIKSGEQVQLAVRITDAGGNHDWRDSRTIPWGDKNVASPVMALEE